MCGEYLPAAAGEQLRRAASAETQPAGRPLHEKLSPPLPPRTPADRASGWPMSSAWPDAVTEAAESAGEMTRSAGGEVAPTPFESVTVADTEKVPTAVGEQLTTVELEVDGEQPVGRPVQVTVSEPEPGEAARVMVTACPASAA